MVLLFPQVKIPLASLSTILIYSRLQTTKLALFTSKICLQHSRVGKRHLPRQMPRIAPKLAPKLHSSPLVLSQGSVRLQSSLSCLAQTLQHPQLSTTRLTPGAHLGSSIGHSHTEGQEEEERTCADNRVRWWYILCKQHRKTATCSGCIYVAYLVFSNGAVNIRCDCNRFPNQCDNFTLYSSDNKAYT